MSPNTIIRFAIAPIRHCAIADTVQNTITVDILCPVWHLTDFPVTRKCQEQLIQKHFHNNGHQRNLDDSKNLHFQRTILFLIKACRTVFLNMHEKGRRNSTGGKVLVLHALTVVQYLVSYMVPQVSSGVIPEHSWLYSPNQKKVNKYA